jgi:amino acid efflux transporter
VAAVLSIALLVLNVAHLAPAVILALAAIAVTLWRRWRQRSPVRRTEVRGPQPELSAADSAAEVTPGWDRSERDGLAQDP